MSTPPEELCCSLLQHFREFLEYVVKLKFDEKPNYTGYMSLFRGVGCPSRPIPKHVCLDLFVLNSKLSDLGRISDDELSVACPSQNREA